MSEISLKEDVYPVSDFRRSSARMIKRIKERHHPIVLTQRGRPSVVVMEVGAYERMEYERAFRASVERGIKDIEAGRVVSHKQVMKELREKVSPTARS